MHSKSISMVLKYLDLAMRKAHLLHKQGEIDEVLERLAILESICARTHKQARDLQKVIHRQQESMQDDAVVLKEMADWLNSLPTYGVSDG